MREAPPLKFIKTSKELRHWWHSLLAEHGRFSIYAVFLALPSNTEAIKYLTEYRNELNLISGKEALIISFTDEEAIMNASSDTRVTEHYWKATIENHIAQGYSLDMAKHFGIDYQDLPCLTLFKDIRNEEYILISLRDLSAVQIARKMQELFSVIRDANRENLDTLKEVEIWQRKDILKTTGTNIASGLRKIAEKSFEIAITAFIIQSSN